MTNVMIETDKLQAKIEVMNQEISTLKEALCFYANKGNWINIRMDNSGPFAVIVQDDFEFDGHIIYAGAIARAALFTCGDCTT